ncbi:MAG: right-handed parallel beta-helix repeat-containing protein [Sedimentisphaerales bacterium]
MKRFLLIAAFALCWTQVSAQTLYVPSGEYSSIQSAINDANNGDTVVVSAGTYQENINFLGKAITVRSIDPNDPNVVAETIIDGNAPADSNFGSVVIFNSGEDTNSVLSGFTITGGTGSWLLIAWEFHGIYWNRCGGGVLCCNMSAPTISKNVFTGNAAGQGGGIYVYGNPVNPNDPSNPPVHVRPVIAKNTFANNIASGAHGFPPPNNNYPNGDHGDGGAIVAFQGVDATITGNLIKNNHADMYGGGIHLRQWSNSLIENDRITDNDSALGAGVHITYNSSPTVRNNLIKSNTAGDFGGGGIYVLQYSCPLIEHNVITENESTNGAGIYVAGTGCIATIRNNLIFNNVNGAGIRVKGTSTATIINNTLVGNTASPSYGGGVCCLTSSVIVIENNIIASNGSAYGIYLLNTKPPPVTKYNNVWGNGAGNYNAVIGDQTGINGNISVDPCFVDLQGNDYHLKSNGWRWDVQSNQWFHDDTTSRCIDAGNPGYVLADELLFVPDDPNGQFSENLRINMGAYGGTKEASLPPHNWAILADITNNGIVDLKDLVVFAQLWLKTGTNNPADFDRNGAVNFADFAAFANDWLRQTSWY